jgi:hypothetical protein
MHGRIADGRIMHDRIIDDHIDAGRMRLDSTQPPHI